MAEICLIIKQYNTTAMRNIRTINVSNKSRSPVNVRLEEKNVANIGTDKKLGIILVLLLLTLLLQSYEVKKS